MSENDKKQLDCQLHCKATAKLDESVVEDMERQDASLKELLNGDEDSATSDS
jgi:hypothetical protein|tara:strand:+ start:554 stop:709 length:156 start_codon:yes stop_codon:yes gene_type:complete